MSLKAMIWVMEDAPVENQGELAVLYALADRASDDGTAAWPSQEWIAYRARCTDRTVRNHLSNLEERGVIKKGDLRHVEHIRQDRRPIVWDLNLDLSRPENWRPENITGRKIGAERPESYDTTAGKFESNDRKPVSDKPSITILKPSENHPTPFEQFWRQYPKKTSKQSAKRAWVKCSGVEGFEDQVLVAVENYSKECEGMDKKYIPHPSTWLNQELWRDYLIAVEEKTSVFDEEAPF